MAPVPAHVACLLAHGARRAVQVRAEVVDLEGLGIRIQGTRLEKWS